jgi:hypothetical protein
MTDSSRVAHLQWAHVVKGSSSAPDRPGFFETAALSKADPIPNVSANRKGIGD